MSAIAGSFWAYATISAVIYAYAFGGALTTAGIESMFAPWYVRVLQYLLLFLPLLGCYWVSLHIAWRPWWRAVPIQVLLGLGFAALAPATLLLAGYALRGPEGIVDDGDLTDLPHALVRYAMTIGLAASTDFFIRYGFGLTLVTGAALYKQVRDVQLRAAALEREWAGARLHALRMQLSPHALFNLLSLIKGQIGWDPAAARETLVMLADLLRVLLRAGDRDFVRLRDELAFAKLYLELQRRRFPERLRVLLPPIEQHGDLWLPSLILQPLIENAVTHGLEGHEGPVSVALDIACDADRLVIELCNDFAADAPTGHPGVGLTNVRERLAVHFGRRASLTTGQAAAARWSARIELPVLTDEPTGPALGGTALLGYSGS